MVINVEMKIEKNPNSKNNGNGNSNHIIRIGTKKKIFPSVAVGRHSQTHTQQSVDRSEKWPYTVDPL